MATLAIHGGEPVRREPFPLYPTYGREEEQAAVETIRSNALTSQVGRAVADFERDYAAYHGVRHAMALSNGTTALVAALEGGTAMVSRDLSTRASFGGLDVAQPPSAVNGRPPGAAPTVRRRPSSASILRSAAHRTVGAHSHAPLRRTRRTSPSAKAAWS